MTDEKNPETLETVMAASRLRLLEKHDSYSIADIPNGQKFIDEIAGVPQGFMDVFGRLTPEEVQRVRQFYQEQPPVYGTSQPLIEVLGRATYVGPSLQEEEVIKWARKYLSEHCSGVKKE